MTKTHTRNSLAALVLVLSSLLISCAQQANPTPTTSPSQNTPASATIPPASNTALPPPTAQPQTQTPTAIPQEPTPLGAAALVNGQAIPLTEYEAQVSQAMAVLSQQQNLDAQTEEGKTAVLQLRRQILDAMIDQTLIEQAAARDGVSVPEEQADQEMARLVGDNSTQFDDWLKANGLTREAFKSQLQRQMLSAALQEHVLGTESPTVEQVHARHILVATEAEAMDLLLRLRAGEGFAALAKQYSQDNASSDNGGDLGFFPRNVMPLEIEAVAFGLSPGQMSGIVKTDFGYHIIEILEKDPARKVPDDMMATWRQNSFLQWLRAERSVAKIKYLVPLE